MLTPLPRRPRRSRLERVLSGLLHIGRYSLPGVLASLAGCVPPPNLIGVSPDGRYLVVPANANGIAVALEDSSHVVRFDLKTNDVQTIGPVRTAAFWMNISGDVIAYGVLEPASVIVHRGNEAPVTIEKALFPSLSPDGSSLVYCQFEEGQDQGKLMRREIATGKTIELAGSAVAPEFAPDGKNVLFVAKANGEWAVHVMDADGKNQRKIAVIDADMEGIFRPRWVDKESIVYRTINADTGSDGELFLADLNGKSQKLTDNDIVDVLPVFAGKDRVIWHGATSKEKLGQDVIPLWLSQRENGKWTSKELGVSAFAFNVIGDDLLYATMEENDKRIKLIRCPIADPSKKTDLTAVIEKKTQGLPASKIGQ